MGREIKFRGKWTANGQWVYGDYSQLRIPMTEQVDHMIVVNEFTPMPVDPATVGQYTGLKDKNGREIYEGDIVEGTYIKLPIDWSEEVGSKMVGQVVYKPGMFRIIGKTRWSIKTDAGITPDYEVIGNIYENPELLEV